MLVPCGLESTTTWHTDRACCQQSAIINSTEVSSHRTQFSSALHLSVLNAPHFDVALCLDPEQKSTTHARS